MWSDVDSIQKEDLKEKSVQSELQQQQEQQLWNQQMMVWNSVLFV